MKHKQAIKRKCEAAVMDAIHDDELSITYDFILNTNNGTTKTQNCAKKPKLMISIQSNTLANMPYYSTRNTY
jgi:hypothetical protein